MISPTIKTQKRIINIVVLTVLCGITILAIFPGEKIKGYQNNHKESSGYFFNIKKISQERIITKIINDRKLVQCLVNKKESKCNVEEVGKIYSDKNDLSSMYNLMGINFFNMAKFYFHEENYNKAEISFNQSLEKQNLNPKLSQNYDMFFAIVSNNLGLTYYKHAMHTKSLDHKKELLQASIYSYNHILETYFTKNNNSEKSAFEKLQCEFLIAKLYYYLGKIDMKERNLDIVEMHLNRAEEILNKDAKNFIENREDIMNNSYFWCGNTSTICDDDFKPLNTNEDYEKFKSVISENIKKIRNGTL